jgi:DNA primase
MDFVEQVRSSLNIVDIVGEHVRLRRSGINRYTGLCPFNSEKNPSFSVHAVLQIYKCFSCGAGGDAFKFVMETQGLSFYEALKYLAERNGIPMPKRSQYSDEDSRQRATLFQLHEIAQEAFRANLASAAGETARAYLAKRGVAPETGEQFGLGYSAPGGRSLLRLGEQKTFTADQMEQSGLAGKRQDGTLYDRFRNRLMFPIHNENGKIIGFGGRALAAGDEPKYLNSPETPIYKKSRVLYNLHRAKEAIRKEDRVILVEGYMDAIGVTAAGFRAVVASCGTALTAQHVQALKRHSQKIVVNFDPDAPGANAAERSINMLLEENMHVRIMELDGGLDPDEYCKQRGAEAYQERLTGAKGYFYWLADRARTKYDVHTSEGVVAVLNSLLPSVQRIADPLERSAIAGDLAAYIGVARGLVLDNFRKSVASRQERAIEGPKAVLRPDERMILNAIFCDPDMGGELIGELKNIEAIGRFSSRRIFQTVFALEGPVKFDEVNARLEEADQNLLAEALFREDARSSREEVLAAIASMRRSATADRKKQLKDRIQESERAGNWQEAVRLAGELKEFERESRGKK